MPRLVVFKGGTAFNSFLSSFHKRFPKTSYIIPVSDDGGSSREIVRVFGGPGIGDLRSTLTRLSDDSNLEKNAVKTLLEMRLDPQSWELAQRKWHAVLEGEHPLWNEMTPKYRGLIHGFLRHFELERLRSIDKQFDLRNGSIGNYFFTGARLFFGSIATPVFIYSSVSSINALTRVIPVIDSNDQVSIAATLGNGDTLFGQSAVSHPKQGPVVSKEGCTPLPSRIEKLHYMNKFGDLFSPQVNPEVLDHIEQANLLLYGVGSLWTSIIPSLIVEKVGAKILERNIPKVLLLNSHPDRETEGMEAIDYIQAIARAIHRFQGKNIACKDCVSHLIYLKNGPIKVDIEQLKALGIQLIEVEEDKARLIFEGKSYPKYSPQNLEVALQKLCFS